MVYPLYSSDLLPCDFWLFPHLKTTLSFAYTSVPLMRCAIRVWCVNGTRLINFSRTWDEQRTPNAWRCIQFSLCSCKKPTNFSLRWMVCELFANGAAQVRSPIHTYGHLVREQFANYSARLCIRDFTRTPVWEGFGAVECSSYVLQCHSKGQFPENLPPALRRTAMGLYCQRWLLFWKRNSCNLWWFRINR